MKQKEFTTLLTKRDKLDVKLMWGQRGILTKFALNYRALINGEWYEVYRVDNFHNFLHEQKFWRSPKPIPLKDEESLPLKFIAKKYGEEITINFKKYRSYFKNALRKK